jgi:hypothetical protein
MTFFVAFNQNKMPSADLFKSGLENADTLAKKLNIKCCH